MRIQILELPTAYDGESVRTPFVVIYSEFASAEAKEAFEGIWDGDGYGDDCVGAEFTTEVVELGPPKEPEQPENQVTIQPGGITGETIMAGPITSPPPPSQLDAVAQVSQYLERLERGPIRGR